MGGQQSAAAPSWLISWRDPRYLRWALALLALAFVLRLVLVVSVDYDIHDYKIGVDPRDYHRHATSIAAGDGYPLSDTAPGGGESAVRPPLYPYFLGGVYAVPGQGHNVARAVQALLGTLTVALIGLLALHIGGRRAGLAAMALAALFPPLLIVDTALVTETLFLPLMLGALLAALAARDTRNWRWTVAAGVLAGLATLTRANGAALLLPLALLLWPGRRAGWRGLAAPALVVACAALTVVPWTIRNALVMDAFIPVSLQAGYTLSGSYNDASVEKYPSAWRPPWDDPDYAPLFVDKSLQEPELEREFRKEVREHIRKEPETIAEVGFWNTARFLHLAQPSYGRRTAEDIGVPGWLGWAGVFAFYPVALLACLGAFSAAARAAPRAIWLAPMLFALTVFVAGFIRYRAPIDVFLLVLAGLAVASFAARRPPGRRPSAARP